MRPTLPERSPTLSPPFLSLSDRQYSPMAKALVFFTDQAGATGALGFVLKRLGLPPPDRAVGRLPTPCFFGVSQSENEVWSHLSPGRPPAGETP